MAEPINDDIRQKLINALDRDDREAVRALIQEGLSVNTAFNSHESPLILALMRHRWQIADDLLELGADPNQLMHGYYSCLGWACLMRQTELADKLLAKGASPTNSDPSQRTPLHWAAQSGLIVIVETLIELGADINAHQGYTPVPLYFALYGGHQAVAERLIEAGTRLDGKDYYDNTLLHTAITSNGSELVPLLLAKGLKAEAVNQGGQTPLHLSGIQNRHETILPLLAAGADINARDNSGLTPLMQAASYGQFETYRMLKDAGADFEAADRAKALDLAIRNQRTEMVKKLLPLFDLARPIDSQHPLRIAIGTKLWPMVKTLLQSNIHPDSQMTENNVSQSLLQWSINQFLPDLTRLLLEAGAQVGREQAIPWLDNLMLLRKNSKLQLAPGTRPADDPLDTRLLLALQKNIESLGFVLSPELAERVLSLTLNELEAFHQLLISSLRALVGADREYKPMYPNFPWQVKVMPEPELYLNALLHYWGDWIGQRIMPHFKKDPRPVLDEAVKLKPIGLAEPDEPLQLFSRLLQARSALRPEDKLDLSWFVFSRGKEIAAHLPEQVPFRENAALLAAALLRQTQLQTQAASYLKNGVDVLRTATALSDGDVSLADNTRFISFSKPVRRWLLARLEASPDLLEDLWRHPEKFKRLGEKLHPGEYRQRYPLSWAAFSQLRRKHKAESYGRRVETGLKVQDIEAILPLLQTRPGDFARRIDHVLRLSTPEQAASVQQAFSQVISRLATPLLLQLMTHFKHRLEPAELRVFFPKGELAKLQAIDNALPALDAAICQNLVELCREALIQQYAKRPALGPCYLDEGLKHYTVPFAMRSASKALKTVARGSRLPFSDFAATATDTMRFFIWWKDGRDRTDLDLSALVLDADYQYQTTLAYYNLKELGGCHSGDITSAPAGASEYIDIEVQPFLQRGARYVMMVVSAYTSQAYCDLPECFAGFMHRQKPNSGELYEPRTLRNKFDLTANSTIAIPLILDLETREVIWTDLSLKRNPSQVNNVHGNTSSLGVLCQAMTNLRKPSLYELFALQIDARGERVYNQEQARTVFTVEATQAEKCLTPFDIPEILSEFL